MVACSGSVIVLLFPPSQVRVTNLLYAAPRLPCFTMMGGGVPDVAC